MPIKDKDFVEINFTGKLKESGQVFDTTDSEVAKNHGFEGEFKPMIVCIGQGHLIKGLDAWMKGKELGKYTNIEVKPEEAYGKKDAKLIRMVPTQQFTKHGIKPETGLQVNIDNIMGTIRTVTGGRTLVDFNHPLAGKELIYDIEILRVVEDKKQQINSLLKLLANFEGEIEIKEGKATIKVTLDIPEEVKTKLQETIKDLVGVEAEFIKEEKKEEKKEKLEQEDKEKTEKKEKESDKIKEDSKKEENPEEKKEEGKKG